MAFKLKYPQNVGYACISKKLAAAASSSIFVKIPYLPEEHLVESA